MYWATDYALQVELAVSNSETAARMVKAKIEKTVLGQVAAHIKAVLQPTAGFVSICLDLEAINRLQLIITPRSVALALLKHTKLKLKADMIRYCFVVPLPSAAALAGATFSALDRMPLLMRFR